MPGPGRPALVVATFRDLWVAVEAARYVASGALGFVYESSSALTALPCARCCWRRWSPPATPWGCRPPAPAATVYLLLAPFTVGLAVPLLHQVRGLLGDAGERGSVLAVQVLTALLAVVPALVLYGHGEDALALLALGAAVRLAGRGRPRPPDRPRPIRARRGLAPCLPGPAAPAQLPGVRPCRPVGGRRAAHRGHGAVPAGRGRPGRARPCAFEPVVHVYYLAPGLCLLLAHERVATGRCGRTAVAGGLLVGWFAVHPAPALWWTAAAPLSAARDPSATGSHQQVMVNAREKSSAPGTSVSPA